ncbi:MAG: DNA repair protein RecO [Candidatus Omnitrophota bacterium]|nr:DNA repair protein RecO [Candidatus Omnitrophota bacterium]
MAVQKTEGIILRKYDLRETSYILVFYTRDFGKVKGVRKGVRNPSPQFAGDLEIFTECEVLFYKRKKKGLDLISRCEALKTFLPIRKDIEKLTYANYFIELVDAVSNDNDKNEELYDILSGSLSMLAGGASPKRIARIFELKLLSAIGFQPQLEECGKCGAPAGAGFRFDVTGGGIVCPRCGGTGIKMSLGTINFMRKVISSGIARTSVIRVTKDVGKEAEKVLRSFLMYQMNKPIRSLSFLDRLEKEGVV